MKKPLNDCSPTVCFTELMTNEWEFLNKEIIKERCVCINKSICLQIVDLLSNDKRMTADVLFDSLTKWISK